MSATEARSLRAKVRPDVVAELRDRLQRYYVRYYRDTLGLPDWPAHAVGRGAEEEKDDERVARLQGILGLFTGRSLLNVGCGTGGFNVAAARAGARSVGVDESVEAVGICDLKRALGSGGSYAPATAEHLPFRDASFDLVTCISTVEHVDNVAASLREMVRVLKPGGALFVYAPSGWALHEKHYKLRWLPWFPHPLAKVYLRLKGRPTGFVETLNPLSVHRCRRILVAAGAQVDELTFSEEDARAPGLKGAVLRAYGRVFKPYIALVARKPAA
jgi:2-polyprenyl-3-methyl-5-hydroxy-6-metoxy-1,4-benzoquinol methylase